MRVEALTQYLDQMSQYPALLAAMLPPFFEAMRGPMLSTAAAAALLLAAGICLLWYIGGRIWPAHKAISIASRAIEGIADPVSFAASFARFDSAINEMPLLRRPWRLFRVGIVIPAQSSRTPVRHHLRAGDYLHVKALEEGGLNFRFFESWGYYFCAAGLVLSLIGLASEFYGAGNAVQGMAGSPLSGLAYKMLPLIAGLIAEMLLVGASEWAKNRLHKDMQRLSRALEARLQFAPQKTAQPAQSYVAQLAAPTHLPAEDFSAADGMRGLSGDVVTALARIETQITEKLPGRIGDAMQPLSEALQAFAKRLSDSNAEALRQAVGELAQGLRTRNAEDLDALSDALAQARSGLLDVGNVLRDAGAHANDQLARAGETLAAQLSSVALEAEHAAAPFPARIHEFSAALDDINTALGRHSDAFAEVVESARTAMAAMNEMLSQPRDMIPPAHAPQLQSAPAPVVNMLVVEDLARAARDMSSSAEAVSETRRLLKRLSSRLRQPATSLMAAEWDQYRDTAEDSGEVLSEVLNNFREGASNQRAGLDAAISEMETRLERLFRDLDSGATRLESALVTLRRQHGAAGTAPADESDDAAA